MQTCIDCEKAIHDYHNCDEVPDCSMCECNKTIGFTSDGTLSLCKFFDKLNSSAREEIEIILNKVL